jgi:hypothetical protein
MPTCSREYVSLLLMLLNTEYKCLLFVIEASIFTTESTEGLISLTYWSPKLFAGGTATIEQPQTHINKKSTAKLSDTKH